MKQYLRTTAAGTVAWRPRRKKLKVRRAVITKDARVLFRAAFPGEAWPRGWSVHWVGFMRGAIGLTTYGTKRILLSWGDRKKHNWLRTLCHEFIHMRLGKRFRHGREFEAMVDRAYARLWQ